MDRGHNFYRAAEGEAAQLGARLYWKLKTVAGAGHHDSQMARAAIPLLFQESGSAKKVEPTHAPRIQSICDFASKGLSQLADVWLLHLPLHRFRKLW